MAIQGQVSSSSSSSSSTFKFLITTDNHLGYQERDPRRGDDSFTTFEECLRAARVEHDVDAILLGGDLFHDNKPSLGCLARTISLLRTYVLGEKPIAFSLLSDPKRNFPTHAVPLANFQDPNINIATPIFTIHGNHDDPVGGTSSIDILATSGLVNYFGQVPSLDEIVVEPVLLKKGQTYVALYGLGNVRDERLHRCFRMKKLHFVHPKPVAGRRWFKILLFHQNRGVRGGVGDKCGIYESMLAGCGLDLVIWGNEHEQQMVPTPSEGYDIIQPGSTILTSLSWQECNPKQYGVLEVRDGSYRMTPFQLRSVRPVVRRTVELWRENPSGRTLDAVEDFLRHVVEEMIGEAEVQIARIPDDVLAFHPNIKYPLMRLMVDFADPGFTNFPQPNTNRFGQQYMDVVVNPGDLLRPVKPKPIPRTIATAPGSDGTTVVVPVPRLNTSDIRTKVAEVFNANARDACALLSEPEVSAAVYAFAEKGEREAIDERIGELVNKCQKHVWKSMGRGDADGILKPDTIYDEVVRYKQDVNKRYEEISRASNDQPQQQDKLQEEVKATLTTPPHPLLMAGYDSLGKGSIALGAPMPSTSRCTDETRRDHQRDDDDEDDALPDTGLGCGVVDVVAAQTMRQGEGKGRIAKGGVRQHTGGDEGGSHGKKRSREVVYLDDDDDDDDNDDGNKNDNKTNTNGAEKEPMMSARGAREVRQRTTKNLATSAPKASRAKRGKQAAAAAAVAAPTPTLQLTHQRVPGEEAPPPPFSAGSKSQAGALNLLSKWASHR